MKQGFTLIELLVVVAIISILASIALPNFQHAQVRAKVTAAIADMRSLKTAIEGYALDNNMYPLDGNDYPDTSEEYFDQMRIQKVLTTPTAFITEVPGDIFHKNASQHENDSSIARHYQSRKPFPYFYRSLDSYRVNGGAPKAYFIFSMGPDLVLNNSGTKPENFEIYDPTNGVVSGGDILSKGP